MLQHYKDRGERVDEVLYQTVVGELERYREALSYYADEQHYEPYGFGSAECDVTEDGGMIASIAIQSYEAAGIIAHARQDVPALIAEVERLQEKVSNQVKFLEQNVIGFKRKNKFIDKLRSSLYLKNENLKDVQMEVHRLRKFYKKLRQKEKNIEIL